MKRNAALAAKEDDIRRPTILYETCNGPEDRDHECGHYKDCVTRVSRVDKARGFTCVGCPSNSKGNLTEEEHTGGMLISVPPPCTM